MMIDDQLIRQLRAISRTANRAARKPVPILGDVYTPTYLGGTVPGATTYTFQSGAWKRIENVLLVRGQVNWSAATGTGNAQISIPFAPTTGNFTGALRLSGVTFANSAPEILLSAGNTFFTLESPLTNAAPTVVQMEAAGSIAFSLFFFL